MPMRLVGLHVEQISHLQKHCTFLSGPGSFLLSHHLPHTLREPPLQPCGVHPGDLQSWGPEELKPLVLQLHQAHGGARSHRAPDGPWHGEDSLTATPIDSQRVKAVTGSLWPGVWVWGRPWPVGRRDLCSSMDTAPSL